MGGPAAVSSAVPISHYPSVQSHQCSLEGSEAHEQLGAQTDPGALHGVRASKEACPMVTAARGKRHPHLGALRKSPQVAGLPVAGNSTQRTGSHLLQKPVRGARAPCVAGHTSVCALLSSDIGRGFGTTVAGAHWNTFPGGS